MATMVVTRRERRYETQSLTQVNGNENTKLVFTVIQRPGLIGARCVAVRSDLGYVAHGAYTKQATFKATPLQHPGDMGGDVEHPFSALDTYQQTEYPFGNTMFVGEKLELVVNHNAAAKTFRWTVVWEELYGYFQAEAAAAK